MLKGHNINDYFFGVVTVNEPVIDFGEALPSFPDNTYTTLLLKKNEQEYLDLKYNRTCYTNSDLPDDSIVSNLIPFAEYECINNRVSNGRALRLGRKHFSAYGEKISSR